MHVTGDLGFSSLVLVITLAIGIVIRRKWRLSVARNEDIKRLLILASEETARAELETTASSYSSVSVSSRNGYYQCAVCLCRTTTRCSRCKAVRYCSGKCQIIHWRQGHKNECCPTTATFDIADDGGISSQKVAKKEQSNKYNDRYTDTPIETSSDTPSSEASVLFKSSHPPGVPHVKEDDFKVDFVADTSISDSLSTSFSGFSISPIGGQSSDDLSVGESISSNELEGSDGRTSFNIASLVFEPSFKKVDETKPVSPKFATMVEPVRSVEKLSMLRQRKTQSDQRESLIASSSTLGQSCSTRQDLSTIHCAKGSSDFWDRSLDSMASSNHVKCDPGLPSCSGAGNSSLSDPESFLQFKFDLSGSNAPTLNAKNSEVKGIVSDCALPGALGVGRPVNASNRDSNVSKPSVLKSVSLVSSSHLSLGNKDVLLKVDSNIPKSSDLRCQPSGYQQSNTIVNQDDSTSHLSKSRVSSIASQVCLSSGLNGPTAGRLKSGKVDIKNADADSPTSFQTTSSTPSSISGLKSSVRKVVDQLRGPKCGKYGDKGLFPYDLFVKLYTSNKVEMRPCGLFNCGNSCYANAVLQCLAFTPPLTAYFVQGLHSKECVNKKCCFTCEFESLILKAKEGESPLSPIGILSQLQNIGSQLGTGREEDAHEFLRYAIDMMQSVCLKEAGLNVSGSIEEDSTLIGLTFGGYLRSKIKCMKCHYKSERHERMMDLTVEIEGNIEKLEDALGMFTGTEILDGDNKYQCSRCKSYEKAKKNLTVLEAPNVLTIALKRFQSDKFGKLNKSIRFPEILDLAPYMSGTSDKSPIYRLYGVVVHLDIMNAAFSGHYVCYVKNSQNKWFKIDDSSVTPVELERVLTKGAYMLLYARCSPRAPRLIRNRIISSDTKTKVGPFRISAENTALNSRSSSTSSFSRGWVPPESSGSVESFYSKFRLIQRILGEDSSSDNYSLTSSNSDEGSCSTESARDSTSTEDLSDFIFGGWNNSPRRPSDSDTSSSSSPLYTTSYSQETSTSRANHADSMTQDNGLDRLPGWSSRVLHSDRNSKQCKKLESSSCRETNSEKSAVKSVKSSLLFRRSSSERTN